MYIFFITFFGLYFLANLYIFARVWQSLALLPNARIYFAFAFVFFAISYVLARLLARFLPLVLYSILLWVGSIWFFLLVYFLLFCLVIDIVRFLNYLLHFLPDIFYRDYPKTKFYLFLVVVAVTFLTAIFGYYNSRKIKIKTIEIAAEKAVGKEYRLVFFSDLHLTPINDHQFLSNIVREANNLHPDLILIGGDIADESSTNLRRWKIADDFSKFKSRFGTFAILGNHEYINNADSIVEYFSTLGVRFLIDDYVVVDGSMVLIGLDELSKARFTGKTRKSLEELTNSINYDLPKILLDHVPKDLSEAQKNNILLQLSGHTHNGQFFPGNLITKLVYEISWGYKKIGATHYYVSSGVGTWGPPIKICSDAEIVLIILKV